MMLLTTLTLHLLVFTSLTVEENPVVTIGRDILHQFYSRFDAREVDLVFVLDRSASVSRSGWSVMLRFVRSLLEHFTISSSNTRVAFVTFSSTVSIDINDLPEGRYNKCSLMSRIQRQLSQKVPSGYTATYEALNRVFHVLLNSRLGAKKAVFVLTDGKSNIGPPPVRASVRIQYLRWNNTWNETELGPQVEVYAFGIKDAYMPELRSIATSLPNHTYFLPNFTTFEQLARSLHDDHQSETWELVGSAALCRSECSADAYCTCGTRTGEYVCVCKEGYQGDGFTCSPCPQGTFKTSVSPYNCHICPSNSTTITVGATSDVHCICHPPYHQNEQGGPCELKTCPPLPEIANGYKFFVPGHVRDEVPNSNEPCLNLPDTSCHYQCNHGYRLDSHPGLICETNGTWTGKVPHCKIVDCFSLDYHHQSLHHGSVTYINDSTTFGSVLNATCQAGWKMFGDSVRSCTQHGTWSGTQAWCIEARCPALHRIIGGVVSPANCSQTRMLPGADCVFHCAFGYEHDGPVKKTCSPSGSWDTTEEVLCRDVTPPDIMCPSDIETHVTEANYAIIHWKSEEPVIIENSSQNVSLTVIGATTSPSRFLIGYHQLKYVARDQAGNEDFCVRSIHVVAKVIELIFCPSDMTVNDIPGNDAVVTWDPPVFRDNNNNTVDYQCLRNTGSRFTIGTHNIRCSSLEGNLHCQFSITLTRKTCAVPPPPLHGSLSCSTGSGFLQICSVSCNDNYDFNYLPQMIYKCDLNGRWNLRRPNKFWPPCSRKYNPRRAMMRGSIQYHYHHGPCNTIKETIVANFMELVKQEAWNICGENSCNIPIHDVQVQCGVEARRKRNAQLLKKNINNSDQQLKPNEFSQRQKRDSATTLGLEIENRTILSQNTVTVDNSVVNGVTHSPTTADIVVTDADDVNKSESTRFVDESDVTIDSESMGTTSELPPLLTKIPLDLSPFVTTFPSNLSSFESEDDSDLSLFETEDAPSSSDNVTVTNSDEQNNNIEQTSANDIPPVTMVTQSATIAAGRHGRSSNVSFYVTVSFKVVVESNSTSVTEMDQVAMVNHLFDYSDILLERIPHLNISFIDNVTESSTVLTPAGQVNFTDPSFADCNPGQVPRQGNYYTVSCVSCPLGTYYENRKCLQCPVGEYQDEEEQLQCKACSNSSTTVSPGATNITDCREPCPLGSFSTTGLEPCIPCAVGYYEDHNGSVSCRACPEMMRTATEGSQSVDDCRRPCDSGSFSPDAGLEPCQMCERDSYQPAKAATTCMLCPNNSMTLNRGADAENLCIAVTTNPCENVTACGSSGVCVGVNGDDVVCDCNVGFSGRHCEINLDDCLSSPCDHNSTCEDLANDFRCFCEPGFTGKTCDLDIDECLSSPCVNNGSCEDIVNGYRCYCPTGFTGVHCESAQECTPVDCHHGNGVFQDDICSCSCFDGYAGMRCDILVDLCSTHPCQNAVGCTPVPNDFTCSCRPGFSGKWCELEINECSSNPCQNGGQCYDRLEGFICKCLPGFAGLVCQNEVSTDFDLVFETPVSSAFVTFPWETVPVMMEVAVCFWVRSSQLMGFGTVFSYTVEENEFEARRVKELALVDTEGLKFYVGGQLIDTGVQLGSSVWNQVCATWSSDGGVWSISVNHTTAASGVGINNDTVIRGGGSFIIGQEEQRIVGESYNFWNSFEGEITEFNLFDDLDIVRINETSPTESCQSLQAGNVIAWTSVIDGIRGGVLLRNKSHCLDINECLFPRLFPCDYRRQCEDLIGSYNCSKCLYGYQGDDCSQPIDECALNVCKNGAWCLDGPEPSDTVCTCHSGYTGYFCDSEIDFCSSKPCLNNGTCTNVLGSGYHCDCPHQNMGDNCEQLGDACWQNPCQNGGLCVADGNHFRCNCREGYIGNFCENNTKYCQTNPCLNGGICIIHSGRQKCICPTRWKGRNCEVSLVPDCSISPCLNGGSCFLLPNSVVGYECECPVVQGVHWDSNCGFANPCDSGPCLNGGFCIHLINNTFRCSCRVGFWGRTCEIDLTRMSLPTTPTTTMSTATVSVCSEDRCLNGGTCMAVGESYSCVCSENYGGIRCELQRQTVKKTYAVTLILAESITIINQNHPLFVQQFKHGITELFRKKNIPGTFSVKVTSIKASRQKSVVDFRLTHTQHVTRLSELVQKDALMKILWRSLVAGSVADFPTSQENFMFEEVKSDESSRTLATTVYLSVGVAGVVILLILSIVFLVLRSRRKRQYKGFMDRVNNSPDLVLNIIGTEESHSLRGSCAEENTYADLGDTVLPYEVTHKSDLKDESFRKKALKECNLDKAAAQKAMDASSSTSAPSHNTGIRHNTDSHSPAAATTAEEDYLHPVVCKNDLGQLEVMTKDDKQLISIGGKGGHVNLAFDKDQYLLPKLRDDFLPNSDEPGKKHVYVNDGQESNIVTPPGGYVPFQPAVPSYVNTPSDHSLMNCENHLRSNSSDVASHNEKNSLNHDCSGTDAIPSFKVVSDNTSIQSHLSKGFKEPASADSNGFKEHSGADMTRGPANGEAIADTYDEPIGVENPPEYLEVIAPESGGLSQTDPAKRKLPPLPTNAVLFAKNK